MSREENCNQFLGKYRGTVYNNIDPLNQGRIIAMVPDVLGISPSSWATPCIPGSGKNMGVWVVPQVGAGVWIEFEQGDPDYPVWTGGFWGTAVEPPKQALQAIPGSPNIVLQTTGQQSFMLSDVPGPTGGILLKTKAGALISVTDAGITISNGKGSKIEMIGPKITITNGVSTLELAGPAVSLKNGAAAIEMAGPSVKINNGALEVI